MLRKFIHMLFYVALYLSLGATANAENLRVYNVVVPWTPGSASDILMRGIEPALNDRLAAYQIKLIVENIPGAAGSIALSSIINNKDKAVFGFFSPFFAINKTTRNDFVYDYDSVNFLSFAGYSRMVVISEKHVGLKELQEYCAKNNPLAIGSTGIGSTTHLIAQYFNKKYLKCADIIDVPYKGTSAVYSDLKAGRIDIMVDFSISANTFIATGYFNRVEEIKDTDLLAWHILVANNVSNPDIAVVKKEFNLLKKDKQFADMLESNFFISKFSDNKDVNWLRNEFVNFGKVIESIPAIPRVK